MWLRRLQLFDYRNFERLDIELGSKVALFVGDNAQGKTNLLEAVYFVDTSSMPLIDAPEQGKARPHSSIHPQKGP